MERDSVAQGKEAAFRKLRILHEQGNPLIRDEPQELKLQGRGRCGNKNGGGFIHHQIVPFNLVQLNKGLKVRITAIGGQYQAML